MPRQPKKAAAETAAAATSQVRITSGLHQRLSVYTARNRTKNNKVAELAIDEYLKKRGA